MLPRLSNQSGIGPPSWLLSLMAPRLRSDDRGPPRLAHHPPLRPRLLQATLGQLRLPSMLCPFRFTHGLSRLLPPFLPHRVLYWLGLAAHFGGGFAQLESLALASWRGRMGEGLLGGAGTPASSIRSCNGLMHKRDFLKRKACSAKFSKRLCLTSSTVILMKLSIRFSVIT